MAKLYYTLKTNYSNAFDVARFNIIWRFNYVLSVLFVLLNIVFLIQGDVQSVVHFIIALLITTGSLFYLFKTKKFSTIYYFISICGILFPTVTMNTTNHLPHYGDIVWLIVAICIAYFGLGSKIGKYFFLAGLISIAIHIGFYLNINLTKINLLTTIDKVALITELTIAFSIVFYIIYQYTNLYSISEKSVMRINFELEKQNRFINEQNLEKETLLKEIHHRVKNNLQVVSSLLNLQSYSLNDKYALAAIKEGQGRIKTMALLHQKLYQNSHNISEINFKDYLTQLISMVASAYNNKSKVEVNVSVENIFFDIDTAVPLGLIANELATNAFKYAFEDGGDFFIGIVQSGNEEYVMEIRDNGKGLPANIEMEKVNTLGLRLVNILSKQLKGKVNYSYDNGSKFVISFIDTLKRREI